MVMGLELIWLHFSAKFQKPTLKRVKMSVSQMLTSILGNKTAQVDMRSNLKKHVPTNQDIEE